MKIDKFANQAIVTNVSRRNLLKGIVGTGGLVLAAPLGRLELDVQVGQAAFQLLLET